MKFEKKQVVWAYIFLLPSLIGIAVLLAGLFYMVKEKNDPESRKIYMITAVIGAVITVFMIFRWL